MQTKDTSNLAVVEKRSLKTKSGNSKIFLKSKSGFCKQVIVKDKHTNIHDQPVVHIWGNEIGKLAIKQQRYIMDRMVFSAILTTVVDLKIITCLLPKLTMDSV